MGEAKDMGIKGALPIKQRKGQLKLEEQTAQIPSIRGRAAQVGEALRAAAQRAPLAGPSRHP